MREGAYLSVCIFVCVHLRMLCSEGLLLWWQLCKRHTSKGCTCTVVLYRAAAIGAAGALYRYHLVVQVGKVMEKIVTYSASNSIYHDDPLAIPLHLTYNDSYPIATLLALHLW